MIDVASAEFLAQDITITLPRLTPTLLAANITLAPALLAAVAEECRASYAATPEAGLNATFGHLMGKVIRRIAEPPAPVDIPLVDFTIRRSVQEAFNSTSPTRTSIGRLIYSCAERLVDERQGRHDFYVDTPDPVVNGALRNASRIEADLPAFTQAVSTVLTQSAAALREHANAKAHTHVRLYRGIRGAGAPPDAVAADGAHYAYRALTSWSLDRNAAEVFTRDRPEAAVIEADVPIGCLALVPGYGEEEVLIFPVSVDRTERTEQLHELTVVAVHRVVASSGDSADVSS